jgi:hypothetical protein
MLNGLTIDELIKVVEKAEKAEKQSSQPAPARPAQSAASESWTALPSWISNLAVLDQTVIGVA